MSLVNNQTWSGQQAADWYSAALLKSKTVDAVSILPNIKSTYKLNRLEDTTVLQEADCTFSDSGTTTLSSNTLTVCDYKINRELCKKDFLGTWMETQMRAGSAGDQVPPSFTDYLMSNISARVGQTIEQKIWTGDTSASPADLCDGFFVKMLADATVVDQASTTLSATVIVAELTKVYNKIPATVINSPKMRIFMGDAAYGYYLLANLSLGVGAGFGVQSAVASTFANIQIVVCPGMSANKIVAAEYDNLVVGTDLLSDFSDLRIIDMEETSGAANIRIVGGLKFGVAYRVGAEIVLYS